MKTTNNRIVKLGDVGVDSGQLVICDPCNLDNFKVDLDGADSGHTIYRHKDTGELWQFTYGGEPTADDVNPFPGPYDTMIPAYHKSPNDLIAEGTFEATTIDPRPHIPDGEFSYRGICKITSEDNQGGQLNYPLGHPGIGVAFTSGCGDGTYEVFAEIANVEGWGERIIKVWVNLI